MTKSLTAVTPKPKRMKSKRKVSVKDVDITSYTSGGEPLTPGDMGLRTIDDIEVIGAEDNGFVYDYDFTNEALIVKNPTGAHTHTENTEASYTQNATTQANAAEASEEVTAGTDVGTVRVKASGL